MTSFIRSVFWKSEVRGFFLACLALYVVWTLCGQFLHAFTWFFCSETENVPKSEFYQDIPFRKYRGRSFYHRRKRVPIYHLIHKRGRHAAIRFKFGVPDPPQKWKPPRKQRRAKPKRIPPRWTDLSPHEEYENKLDEFERIKPRFLHNSFVMFELRYGVSLQEFVKELDPIKSFRLVSALSRPQTLKRVSKSTTINDMVSHEVDKYRFNVCYSDNLHENDHPSCRPSIYLSKNDDVPVVIDTGASFCLTPCISDFVGPLQASETTLTGLNSVTTVAGTGIVEWTIQDVTGLVKLIRCRAFYVPDAKIRLFSPQQYFMDSEGGNLYADRFKTVLTTSDGVSLEFPYNGGSRLPMMLTRDYLVQSNVAGLSLEECSYLASTHALPSIVDSTNMNLTSSQKELLLWHQKLGHLNMRWIQSLGRVSQSHDSVRQEPVLRS
jgi:hypothetical protein